jgi:hypothetical protein
MDEAEADLTYTQGSLFRPLPEDEGAPDNALELEEVMNPSTPYPVPDIVMGAPHSAPRVAHLRMPTDRVTVPESPLYVVRLISVTQERSEPDSLPPFSGGQTPDYAGVRDDLQVQQDEPFAPGTPRSRKSLVMSQKTIYSARFRPSRGSCRTYFRLMSRQVFLGYLKAYTSSLLVSITMNSNQNTTDKFSFPISSLK